MSGAVRKISFKRMRNRNTNNHGDQDRVPVLPIHDKYDQASNVQDHLRDPFDDIIGAEIQITAAASGVVPDDSFTVTQAVNALGFGKFQIILRYVVVHIEKLSTCHSLIRAVLIQSCSAGAKKFHQLCILSSTIQWCYPK